MAHLDRGVHWLIVVGIWLTVAYKPTQGGYCREWNGTKTRTEEKTYKFFNVFEFTCEYDREYPVYTCCQGYHGDQCDQISDACRQNASCRGHWCETEEPQYWTLKEITEERYLGGYTRPVRKVCDTPLKKEGCCAGFSGKTCATKNTNELLSEREAEDIKSQLIIDEGTETKIYTFAGVKKFGIGHVIKKEEPENGLPDETAVSEERIEEAFTADLHIAASDVTKLFSAQWKKWPSEAKEVVVNIMFNTKIDGFKRIPELEGAVSKGQWHNAATILEDSAWITAVKDRGARLVETLRSLVVILQDEKDDNVTEDQGEGNFTKWSDWSLCTSRCDRKGLIFDQIKTRSCKPGKICDGEIRKTQSCSIMERDNSDDDYLCKCKSGTCKSKAKCNTGLTQAGLCGGDADIICCLPKAKKLACTNEWAKFYACAILDNQRNITLRDKDGKNNTYAGPKKNIQDACDGLSASRSYYKDSSCWNPGAPGGEICLTATLLKFIYDVSEMKTGLEVTSLAGHNHGCKSYHYKGKAVDMSKKDNLSAIGNLCRGSLQGFFKETYDSHWHCTVAKPKKNITLPDPDAPCEDINGICQESKEKSCEGGYRAGLCDSRSVTRKCCVWGKMGESDTDGVESQGGEGVGSQGEGVESQGEGAESLGEGVESQGEGAESQGEGVESQGQPCNITTRDSDDKDYLCKCKGGECNSTAECDTGLTQSGLCDGNADRICCIPRDSCSNVNIVTRSQWGARAPTKYSTMHVPVSKFFIHHTAGSSCHNVTSCSLEVRKIQAYHMDDHEGKGWADIGYSFLVGEDGNIYEGRGWTHIGAHTKGHNAVSVAASFMGNYMTELPGLKALQAAKNLIACGVSLGNITPDYRLYGHRDAKATDCPGDELYAEIQGWPHYNHTKP